MGHITHHAIVITSCNEKKLYDLVEFAIKVKATFLGPSVSGVNGHRSVLICPDGSKSGWEESDIGDEQRRAIIEFMGDDYEWVEVKYGDDDWKASISDSKYSRYNYDD